MTKRLVAIAVLAALGLGGAAVSWPDKLADAGYVLRGVKRDPAFAGTHFDSSGRQRVDCAQAAGPRGAVIVALGQSNAANHGESRYAPLQPILQLNPHDGRCYRLTDPLLGASYDRGSPWGRLGDRLVEGGAFDRVLVVPGAQGATKAEEWAPGGWLHPRINRIFDELAAAGLSATHVVWVQGESDNATPPELYRTRLDAIFAAIRARTTAPIYVSRSSRCERGPFEQVRAVQAAVVSAERNIRPGPDTDAIGVEMRFDGCHFATSGLDRHAELWAAVLGGSR